MVVLSTQLAFCQLGGRRSFEFLSIHADTRTVALGGVNVSGGGEDINMFFNNPGSLNPEMQGQLTLQEGFYYANINITRAGLANVFKKTGTWGFGIQHVGYGEIDSYDPSGADLGQFKAGESMLVIGNGQQAGNFRFGINLKMAYSKIGSYHAMALLFDIGGMFIHPSQELTLGMKIKDLGFLLQDYTPSSGSNLPFDLQIGTTFKPRHMPFRFSITAYNLYLGDILYADIAAGDEEPGTFSRIFGHFNFGTELILNKNVNLRAGYNYLIRHELRLEQKIGGAGLSFGLMIKVKTFEFSYSRAIYHVAGGINYLGITSNLSSLYKKSKIENNS